MKTGLYLRFVPSINEDLFYFYDGCRLWFLGSLEFFELEMPYIKHRTINIEPIWLKSAHEEPSEAFGFELVEEWV